MRRIFAAAIMIGVIGGLLGMPARSSAQVHETYRQHRDKERNKWRDLAIASGAVGIIGILNGNDTLTAVGVGGAAYSAYRYSEDGKRRYYQPRPRPVYVAPARPRGGVYVNGTIVIGGGPRYVPVYRRPDDWRWRHDNGRHLGWYKHGHDEDEHRGWSKHEHEDNGKHNGWFKQVHKNNGWLKGDRDNHGNKWFKDKDKEKEHGHGRDKD